MFIQSNSTKKIKIKKHVCFLIMNCGCSHLNIQDSKSSLNFEYLNYVDEFQFSNCYLFLKTIKNNTEIEVKNCVEIDMYFNSKY